ncbi:DNA-binding transcriptional regulator, MarR family [Clostridium acidisoli DSM 12555]|uniref:DNA-binding transcriptional regulator, MarR family n=1 Tax=Clostridium acidisoli DSM 12555 TaxID=1121291 RepID=A0A1W1XF96_9CLOT|nr:MarR family transcriptional regulator [Clostridium acidisoli]SMC22268.1 DNA-binding transcriptional regulator, MarR family [Clostridium acidisoli DSM 12555]
MDLKNKLFDIHEFYNLSRYLFLNIEWDYNNFVKKTGITLPQLRVLWIIKIFEGISLGEIAKIGCWSPPTVTKILKLLMDKNLVVREETENKKLYTLNLTGAGHNLIEVNKMKKQDKAALIRLLSVINDEDLDFIIEILKSITLYSNNVFLFEYIKKLNELGLKVDFDDFNFEEKYKLKKLILFYNLLRTFVLNLANNHRNLLVPLKLTYPQLRILWIVDAFPGVTSVKLSKLAYLAPSTANIVVKKLYEKNLIYKEKSKLKNSLFLYISQIGEELLIKEFDVNQKSFLIYKDLQFISTVELPRLNQIMLKLNLTLKNDFVKEYIEKTFEVIKKNLVS